MLVFLVGIISAWARGLTIDCGCFGGGGAIAAAQTHVPRRSCGTSGSRSCATWLVIRPRTAFTSTDVLF